MPVMAATPETHPLQDLVLAEPESNMLSIFAAQLVPPLTW